MKLVLHTSYHLKVIFPIKIKYWIQIFVSAAWLGSSVSSLSPVSYRSLKAARAIRKMSKKYCSFNIYPGHFTSAPPTLAFSFILCWLNVFSAPCGRGQAVIECPVAPGSRGKLGYSRFGQHDQKSKPQHCHMYLVLSKCCVSCNIGAYEFLLCVAQLRVWIWPNYTLLAYEAPHKVNVRSSELHWCLSQLTAPPSRAVWPQLRCQIQVSRTSSIYWPITDVQNMKMLAEKWNGMLIKSKTSTASNTNWNFLLGLDLERFPRAGRRLQRTACACWVSWALLAVQMKMHIALNDKMWEQTTVFCRWFGFKYCMEECHTDPTHMSSNLVITCCDNSARTERKVSDALRLAWYGYPQFFWKLYIE